MTDRKRRSERMSQEEVKAFKKLFHSFPTKTDAEVYFGLSRQVLDLVAIKGSGSPNTVGVIREKLDKNKEAA
jgi:hypothetical protein